MNSWEISAMEGFRAPLEPAGSLLGCAPSRPAEGVRPPDAVTRAGQKSTALAALGHHVRKLLRTPLVCIFLRDGSGFALRSISAESEELATSVRIRHDRKAVQFASDLAERCLAIGEPITVQIDPSTHFLGDLIFPGAMMAAPLQTSGVQGMVAAYPRQGEIFTAEERTLVADTVGFAAIALANVELYATAQRQVEDLSRMEQANRHWIDIFNAVSELIVVHDEGNTILRVNQPLADFVGVPPQALMGVSMCALIATENPALLHACPFCHFSDEAEGEYVQPVLERTFLVSTSRVSSAGEGAQIVHVLKDVTDGIETERRYRELFSNIQEGMFFFTPEGRFVEVNDALVRMLGYSSREDLLQADVRAQIYASPERFQAFADQMRQSGVVRNHEETLVRKDGSPVYVLINASAVRDAQARIFQYRGLILDITGLKNYQVELQRERDFSGKILSNTQSLILVVDAEGRVTYANRRWFDMGYEQKNLLGLELDQLVPEPRRSQLQAALDATLDGQQVNHLELQILRGDGRSGQFAANLSPMRDEQGIVTSVVAVMTDITDAATLQAQLMHAEKMVAVGQLVSGVAHEVNNPLTAILGFSDLLMQNPEVPESARRDLRVILQEAQRTKQIVQNLLSFARQMPAQRTSVQINLILSKTVQLRSYDFHSHGMEVVEHFDESLPEVIGDPQQLQQVFLNILNNAYDATGEAGRSARIEIITARRANFVEVLFRDNGPGISHPDRIFDPFFTTKEVGKGTGLGLSICYGIVREHGGEILCHNNSNAPGATFIVRLPLVSKAAPADAAAGGTLS